MATRVPTSTPTAVPTHGPNGHGPNCLKLGDATMNGTLDTDDILAVRAHMFGTTLLPRKCQA